MEGAVSRRAAWLRAALVAAVVVAVDQGSKALVVRALNPGERSNVFYGLDLTFVKNDGIAFGALGGGGDLILVLVVASVLVLLGWFMRHGTSPYAWLAVGLVLGGALGNVVDRVRLGHVIDFIDPIAWPAFNLADVAIVVGVGVLLLLISSPRQAPVSG